MCSGTFTWTSINGGAPALYRIFSVTSATDGMYVYFSLFSRKSMKKWKSRKIGPFARITRYKYFMRMRLERFQFAYNAHDSWAFDYKIFRAILLLRKPSTFLQPYVKVVDSRGGHGWVNHLSFSENLQSKQSHIIFASVTNSEWLCGLQYIWDFFAWKYVVCKVSN